MGALLGSLTLSGVILQGASRSVAAPRRVRAKIAPAAALLHGATGGIGRFSFADRRV